LRRIWPVVVKLGKAKLVADLAVAKKELELERKIETLASEITEVNKELSLQIIERNKTAGQLEEKVFEIKWVNQQISEREVRVIDLKKEINALLKKHGKSFKYLIHEKTN
jgi:septal ring factor EnvC (AmiA/AmiB activator)